MAQKNHEFKKIPLLALRGLHVFPGMLLTFDVERPASIAALNSSIRADQIIFLSAQKDLSADMPTEDEIYPVGTVCRIRQQLRQPHGNICRVMVEGLYRAKAESMHCEPDNYYAYVEELPDKPERVSADKKEALFRSCLNQFEQYIQYNGDMINEQLLNLLANPDPAYVSNYLAQNVRLSVEDRQLLLEERYPTRRLALINRLLTRELSILSIEKELSDQTQEAMNRSQRDYYLREEMKIIQAELGEDDDIEIYREKIEALAVTDEVREKLLKELGRLSKQPFGSSEAAVLRNYLDICLEIPWGVTTKETINIAKARKKLDDDHFGLEKVKERILEYLAVKQLSPDVKGGLLCLVGPPGTGKTSIAQSIAAATNRKLVRLSLGGVHDEAEIRGHRRTYIGSMPGRIISGVIQAKSCNPLMVLDEIDKLAADYRGDPAAALLEALDGEQNGTFRDNFLELPFDLSGVFFITTANTTSTIPRASRSQNATSSRSSAKNTGSSPHSSGSATMPSAASSALTPANPVCETLSARSPTSAARRHPASRRRSTGVSVSMPPACRSCSAPPDSSPTPCIRAMRSALCVALPGPRWAARCWMWRPPLSPAPASLN